MIGLILAVIDSVFNALTDIARKKVLDEQHDAALVSFWCKALSLVFFAAGLVFFLARGVRVELPRVGAGMHMPPTAAFAIYLALNTLLEGTAILLNLRALQLSPISLCTPFLAVQPLFLLPTGWLLLHETITGGMVLGVLLVVVGSLVVNRKLFAHGLLEPARAILRERGCRYMLMVALLLTCTATLDKYFATSGGGADSLSEKMARSLVMASGKCALLALFFVGLTVMRLAKRKPAAAAFASASASAFDGQPSLLTGVRRIDWVGVLRSIPTWLVLAGLFEALVLVVYLTAAQFLPVALVISIKRSGVILAVLLGWLMFRERGITDRLIGACVMLSGVLVFFLTRLDASGHSLLNFQQALGVGGAALAGMAVALYLTRDKPAHEMTLREAEAVAVAVDEE